MLAFVAACTDPRASAAETLAAPLSSSSAGTPGNGNVIGFGVNVSPTSKSLPIIIRTAVPAAIIKVASVNNVAYSITQDYAAAAFAKFASTLTNWFITNRANTSNPFAGASYAFFPYRTGDLHHGNSVSKYPGALMPTHHYGYRKSFLWTQVLRQALAQIDHKWISGCSAGGWGAVLHYGEKLNQSRGARIDLISDSAEQTGSSLGKSSWLQIAPVNCTDCDLKDYSSFLPALASADPTSRFAALFYTLDTILSTHSGQSQTIFFSNVISPYVLTINKVNDAKTFTAPGAGHVVLSVANLTASGVSLKTWLQQMVSDSSQWTTVPTGP